MNSPHLAGIHFTGSTAVFQGMWKTVADNLKDSKYYPRIVGETGGKDFIDFHSCRRPQYYGKQCCSSHIGADVLDEFHANMIYLHEEHNIAQVTKAPLCWHHNFEHNLFGSEWQRDIYVPVLPNHTIVTRYPPLAQDSALLRSHWRHDIVRVSEYPPVSVSI